MNTQRFFIGRTVGFLILMAIVGSVYLFTKHEPTFIVGTFEECVAAGNPVMESYPRQCTSKDGKHFTENIGNILKKTDLIRLTSPLPNNEVTSPFIVTGEARGSWFFEASFPVYLTDWDGKIIAEGLATAEGDWMTTDFVLFKAILTYNSAEISGQYSNRGTLILKKDNPSGLSKHDDALEIPVVINSVGASDPKNATFIIDKQAVTLKDGVSEIETPTSSTTKIITQYFGNEIVHDLDGDGRDDTAFILTQNTGGSGTFYYVVAALNTPQGYFGSHGLLLGDRISPQTTEKGKGKVIVINYADRKVGESFAVSPSVGKSIWLLLDSKTMQFGEVVKTFEGESNL